MHFYVIKLKWLIAMAAVTMCLIIGVCANIAAPAFFVNGREVPIYSVERNDNKIAMTFNCAWGDDDVGAILDALDDYNVKATFFLTGEWARKYPESVREIYSRGHEIGTHSMAHGDYTKMSGDEIISDISECEEIIFNITTDRPRLVRAPSGAYNDTVIHACESSGRIYIQWSVDTIDYAEDATEESIIERATARTKPGDIILLHAGTAHTADALPFILENLTDRFELTKVSSMIYLNHFIIDGNGVQKENETGG